MELLTLLLRLPFLPLQGIIRLADLIREEAEEQYYSPTAARRELEEAERARESGRASEEDVDRAEYDALSRMMAAPGATPAQVGRTDEEQ